MNSTSEHCNVASLFDFRKPLFELRMNPENGFCTFALWKRPKHCRNSISGSLPKRQEHSLAKSDILISSDLSPSSKVHPPTFHTQARFL